MLKLGTRATALENAVAMYDVRCTMYDLQSLRALRGTAKQERAECDKAVRGNR